MVFGPFYVQPVNLRLLKKDKAWELWCSGDGKLAEFTDAELAYRVADLLNAPAKKAEAEAAGS